MDIDQQLQQLTTEFKKSIPKRIGIIADLWPKMTDHSLNDQAFAQLHNETHKLAGTAAAYGLNEVSQTARQLESMLDRYAEHGQLVDAELDRASTCFDRLTQVCLSTERS